MFKFIQSTDILTTILSQDRRVLLYGPPGAGKSTLATQLGRSLFTSDRNCYCISADPGSPLFGVPGAVSLATWQTNNWQVTAIEALCTLDAGRFRVPLLLAVQRLAQSVTQGVVLVDGPGVVRGIAGKELLTGLVEMAAADAIVILTATGKPPPLADELHATGLELFAVHADPLAQRPGKKIRAKKRTAQWDIYLADAKPKNINLNQINLIGTPPPRDESSAWTGRQVALLKATKTIAMGEVQRLDGDTLLTLLPASVPDDEITYDSVLVRNALRTVEGVMETAEPFLIEPLGYLAPPDRSLSLEESGGPRVVGRVGAVDIDLVNGLFGDPLLRLRMRHQRRSLLFDLGEGERLPARLAHQVSDVFIGHAHFDHIGGFVWLLRSLIGEFPSCRLYGPPGLARHIAGFISGILWDRVAERGPCFEVTEIYADHVQRYRLQAGRDETEHLGQSGLRGGILLEEPGFKVRAAILDHNQIPVIAYAYEPVKQINVRKDRLLARNLQPGHWLTELKQHLLAENLSVMIQLPDGSEESAGTLGEQLTLVTPPKKLAYATDLADTPDNRERLTELAHNAHTFFCEASFLQSDAEQAKRTGHLTTYACGEIATTAGVARLVPFHFSRRYTTNPQQLYDEISDACDHLVIPRSMSVFTVRGTEAVMELED